MTNVNGLTAALEQVEREARLYQPQTLDAAVALARVRKACREAAEWLAADQEDLEALTMPVLEAAHA